MTAGARNLPALLQGLRDEGFSGTVRVSGTPGGTIHLRQGLIGAIETPGAPPATSLLLTPGRVDDEAWLAARAAQPDVDLLGGQLVAAGLIGAAELEVVCVAAVFDAAFAMGLGPPGSWQLSGLEPTLRAEPGVEPRKVTEETTRRIALLAEQWGPPGELVRVRPTPSPDAAADGPPEWLSLRHRSVLAGVNGRRTARDIAFTLGRGLYAVMLDLIRLRTLGFVRWEPGAGPRERPSTAPRVLPTNGAAPEAASRPARAAPLPRRTPGGNAWRRGNAQGEDPTSPNGSESWGGR
ncbi:hypothetical protein ABZ725_03890 [Streptomyces sp. NPDC006872]|uniref:hypothetical protein n=1 Tax=Streptomyces sp. NPDC006872 TaxID=3155720 RepID=UPI0034110E77